MVENARNYLKNRLRNMTIRQRMILLSFANIFMTFLMMSLVYLVGILAVWNLVDNHGREWSTRIAEYVKENSDKQRELHLQRITAEAASDMDMCLSSIADDAKCLAVAMSRILKAPQNYAPRNLPDIHREKIPMNTVYLLRGKKLARGISPQVKQEIASAANMEDVILSVTHTAYVGQSRTVFISSKHGYSICANFSSDPTETTVKLTHDYMDDFEATKHSWYRLSQETDDVAFTTFLTGPRGNTTIGCVAPFYDADGFSGTVIIYNNLRYLHQEIMEALFNNADCNIVMNEGGQIVVSTDESGELAAGVDDVRNSSNADLAAVARRMTTMENGDAVISVNGLDYYINFVPIKKVGWSAASLMRKDVADAPVASAKEYISKGFQAFKEDVGQIFFLLIASSLVLLGLLLVVPLRLSLYLSRGFLQRVNLLVDGVQQISGGNFDQKLDIRTGDEIETLARSVNDMADKLKEHIATLTKATAEKEHYLAELEVASNIQNGALPQNFEFHRDDFELFASMKAAREVGGDFYDFFLLDDHHLALAIADVSGKGVPAALFMMRSKTILASQARGASPPFDVAAILSAANRQLCQNNGERMFVTMFFGVLDTRSGEFRYVNAGHNPPLLCRRAEGKAEWSYFPVEEIDPVLGARKKSTYRNARLSLAPGDMLFLYTDGVTEAMDEGGTLYTEKRLKETLDRMDSASLAVPDILKAVEEDIASHTAGAEQSDDITMLGLRFRGSQ